MHTQPSAPPPPLRLLERRARAVPQPQPPAPRAWWQRWLRGATPSWR